MISKILGLLALSLLAGPIAANASYVYSFTENTSPFGYSFVLTRPSLITTETVPAGSFDQLTAGVSTVEFTNLDLSTFDIRFPDTYSTFGFSGTGPVTSPGTYCGAVGSSCDVFSLTLETSSVPEPVPLPAAAWLLLSGLGGLGLVGRRRKVA